MVPNGKLTLTFTDANAETVNENLGYIQVDIMDDTWRSEHEEDFQTIKTFVRAIANLTNGTYKGSTVTYEVDIDTISS